MAKYSIYLSGELDTMVRTLAQSLGITPAAAIRLKLETARLSSDLARLERKLDALFLLLEATLPELGYAAGATRAVSAKVDAAAQEGHLVERAFGLAVQRLKGEFTAPKGDLL